VANLLALRTPSACTLPPDSVRLPGGERKRQPSPPFAGGIAECEERVAEEDWELSAKGESAEDAGRPQDASPRPTEDDGRRSFAALSYQR